MKKLNLLLCYLLIYSIPSNAQWTIQTNFSSHIHDLKAYNGLLYIGGNFTSRNFNPCYWSSSYDGNNFFDQMNLIGGTGIDQFEIFNGQLHATGNMQIGSTAGVYKWAGTVWTGINPVPNFPLGMFADGNDLYVGNENGVVYKKTGTNAFVAFPALDNASDEIQAITKYNGNLIIAGHLNQYNTTDLNNIARFDGTNWLPLGTGLSGGMSCSMHGCLSK